MLTLVVHAFAFVVHALAAVVCALAFVVHAFAVVMLEVSLGLGVRVHLFGRFKM